ncbi:3'-5' exonuclease [Prauserella halophila]|uniref:3'-5' exonuclease n=1 Tax=Prauserella halophila TaxID=185641 RepID=A0ABN1VZG8_9PSEU|nr:UvrD-helicase domain-containing protein [Prauserella halophila]MCP2235229.1 DNA helicase-2 / ATP-dependent DNA helicase PcrA [Prauserella halophila]
MTGAQTRDEEQEQEHHYLSETLNLLSKERERLTADIDTAAGDIDARKKHLWDNLRDMDFAEKANYRGEVDLSIKLTEHAEMLHKRVERLLLSPYFGRVDFHTDGESEAATHYIGVHNFSHPETQQIVIHDWRAPVSSLFYDYETGRAAHETPKGTAHGDITRKRQYKISGGRLEYMFDSALNIGDEILQRELGESADDRMRNIVATIQREQNAVIRNDTADVLILQGVAGSGKTSIALHRVAFLLYRFKDTLSSDNVMILSPNKVFGDYIADVLPELGEERVAEIDFDRIASRFLDKVTGHETFGEQVVTLLDRVDDAAAERMRFKATPEFVTRLDEWIASLADEFTSAEIAQRTKRLSADWVADAFEDARAMPIFTRLEHVADTAVHVLKNEVRDRGGTWSAADTNGVRKQVRAMLPYKDAFAVYRTFYSSDEWQDMFRPLGKKKIEYSDVFPLIYTMLRTSRQETFGHIRHLLVDEMQDYTAVQYAVLRELFSCQMTILGDSNQSVNPFSSSSPATIHDIFPDADRLELCKSYRSTAEITEFAQNISRNDKLVPIERHGPPPRVVACADQQAEVLDLVDRHSRSDHRSLGIICKTVAQAAAVHRAVTAAGVEATLLDYDSTAFGSGIIITSAHISKGLEFDHVVVPGADDENYVSEMDKCMLYIACTRAMHELHVIHEGPPSRFLSFAADSGTAVVTQAAPR